MTAFHSLVPSKAIEMIEAAGIPHAARLIRDHAAAGLVKSYAALVETIEVGVATTCVRGATVPVNLWRRIIAEGVDDDVWTGGTVRLAPSDLVGGAPAVSITGIGFNGADLQRLIDQHLGVTGKAKPKRTSKAAPPAVTPKADEPAPEPTQKRRRAAPDLSPLHSGALLLTVQQAGAALAKGKTSIYKMIDAGKLERPKGETRVTAASVRRCAGLGD